MTMREDLVKIAERLHKIGWISEQVLEEVKKKAQGQQAKRKKPNASGE